MTTLQRSIDIVLQAGEARDRGSVLTLLGEQFLKRFVFLILPDSILVASSSFGVKLMADLLLLSFCFAKI